MKRSLQLQRHEELRKLAHIGLGCIIAGASLYVDRSLIVLVVMVGLAADVMLREFINYTLPNIKTATYDRSKISLIRIASLIARTVDNMTDVGRRTYGDYAYVAGIVISALIFDRPFTFIAAVLILALSDGLAGLIGRTFGSHQYAWFGVRKSYLGSAVFFLITSFVSWQLLIASQIDPANAALGALIIAIPTTLLESAIGYGLDNFAVPLAAGLLFELMV